jgi:hypothetical protein
VLNIRKSTGKPKLIVPKDLLKQRLIQTGFANLNGSPRRCSKLIYLPDHEIIQRFNSILRGILNFYNMAEDRWNLNESIYILEFSLAHTLASKHRSTLSKIFRRYGKPIKVFIKDRKIQFDTPTSLTAEYLNERYYRVTNTNSKMATPTF